MKRVAVIGLGAMGAPIARRLLADGCQVAAWNRSPDRSSALREAGAMVAASPADAARRAEAVSVMVTGPRAVREVTEGEHGVAAALVPGAVLLQMSTVSPSSVRRLARELPAGTEVLLDAPVLGSVAEAASGSLRILVGGPPALVEQCFAMLGVLGEALVLGRAMGLSGDALYEVLSVTPLRDQAARRREAIEAGDYPARFALALARKDADLVAGAAHDLGLNLGLNLRLTAAARRWLTEAERAGRAGQDYTAVLAHILDAAAKGTDR